LPRDFFLLIDNTSCFGYNYCASRAALCIV
jgi:hypothetical protein